MLSKTVTRPFTPGKVIFTLGMGGTVTLIGNVRLGVVMGLVVPRTPVAAAVPAIVPAAVVPGAGVPAGVPEPPGMNAELVAAKNSVVVVLLEFPAWKSDLACASALASKDAAHTRRRTAVRASHNPQIGRAHV